MHLVDERHDRVPDLHRRASAWYEQDGQHAAAIHHALAAEDFERAADLIEMAIPAVRSSRQEATMLAWLQALPNGLLKFRPVLSVHYAGAFLVSGQLDGVETHLRDAERWLGTSAEADGEAKAPSTAMVVVDQEEFRRLPRAIAVYRAAQALAVGDVAATMTHARRALDLVAEDDHIGRGSATGFLGLVQWRNGELEEAHGFWAQTMSSLLKAGYVADAIGSSIALAEHQARARPPARGDEHLRAGVAARDWTGPCGPGRRRHARGDG